MSAFAGTLGLIAVGLISWRRTADLRRGAAGWEPNASPAVVGDRAAGTSRTTYLAAWVGASVAAAAAVRLSDAPGSITAGVLGVAALAWGLAILVPGLAARVISVTTDGTGMRIAYAARAERYLAWSAMTAVVPPRWPLAAWRVRSVGGAAPGLMPSDLLGNEGALRDAIRRAGLRFDGRAWTRPGAAQVERPLSPPS